jgi:SAM-dependent methyltransferase
MKNRIRDVSHAVSRTPLLLPAWNAYRYAKQRQAIGISFAEFGRNIGWRLLRNRKLTGMDYLLNPVHITRYFEFAFALSCLPTTPQKCLDVSSPRLFSLYVAQKYPDASITVINPDKRDILATGKVVNSLNYGNIHTDPTDIQALGTAKGQFDTIWSISVVEHINGKYDDSDAMQMIYDALAPGGRVIITIPVDRQYWIEYRSRPSYGLQAEEVNNRYFYQRFYDQHHIEERLLKLIGRTPLQMRWFGEKEPGHFRHYIEQSTRDGHRVRVEDPRIITDHYTEYRTFSEMPGIGVCGLVVDKP